MAYLTDKEKRLLFSALTREKKVCVEVDKECCREAYEDTLESVVKNLEKKFYYDRFEKEIRAKAIDEFAEKLSLEVSESIIWDMLATMSKNSSLSDTSDEIVDYVINTANEIAEQLKAGIENDT